MYEVHGGRTFVCNTACTWEGAMKQRNTFAGEGMKYSIEAVTVECAKLLRYPSSQQPHQSPSCRIPHVFSLLLVFSQSP